MNDSKFSPAFHFPFTKDQMVFRCETRVIQIPIAKQLAVSACDTMYQALPIGNLGGYVTKSGTLMQDKSYILIYSLFPYMLYGLSGSFVTNFLVN